MEAWGITFRTLSLSSFSKPFITDETIISTATPREVEIKARAEMKERKPDFLPFKYLKAINKGV